MNEKLYLKLKNEEPLTAAEHLELEQALEAGDQSLVAHYLADQDFVEPSMAWRSSLNEKLREIAPQPVADKGSRFKWLGFGGLVAASAVACAAMVAMVLMKGGNSVEVGSSSQIVAENEPLVSPDGLSGSSDFGSALIAAHQSDTAQASVGVRSPRSTPRMQNVKLDYNNW